MALSFGKDDSMETLELRLEATIQLKEIRKCMPLITILVAFTRACFGD